MNLFLMNPRLTDLSLLARSYGEIGNAARFGDGGSTSCEPKPFCSPLARLSTQWQRTLNLLLTCKRGRSGPIGDSVGLNVSHAMLVPLPPLRLRSLSMVSQFGLLKHLALMC